MPGGYLVTAGRAAATVITLAIAICTSGPVAAATAGSKPNILVILSDDHGYADVGFQGSTEVATPHLDALAKSGIRCSNGYASHPFCSPTRAGLLTGRCQARFGHENNPVYDPLDETEGLPLTERLLPQFMKESGYTTGTIGKWHLGASPSHTPWQRGFDETFGFIGGGHIYRDWEPNGRQYTLPITRNGEPTPVTEHLTGAFGTEAAAFIARHTNEPWLLYLAFNAPHTPHQPTIEREQQFMNITDPNRRKCLAQISLLDDAIGTVTASLDASGQRGQTLVFFFSDNGGSVTHNASNGPLHGQKGQVYEGGIHVPFVVSWPGRLPAGGTYDFPVWTLDIFATSLGLAGIPMPTDKKYDGVNLLPYLSGEIKTPPHDRLFWRTAGGKSHAIREGRWKLVRLKDQPAELYDLDADLGETKNLAASLPEVVSRLEASLNAWGSELIAPVFPGSSVKSEDWGPGGANQKNSPKSKKK